MLNEKPTSTTFDPAHYATSGDIATLARLMKAAQETPKTKFPSNIGYKIITIILLLVIAAMLTFNQFHKSSLTAECRTAISKANVVIADQNDILNSQLTGYQTAVYDTPSVDNIYKQILMANEFEFTALNMIAMQNAALLDITTNCK